MEAILPGMVASTNRSDKKRPSQPISPLTAFQDQRTILPGQGNPAKEGDTLYGTQKGFARRLLR